MKAILVILLLVLLVLQVRLWAGAGSVAEIVRLENAIEAQHAENAQLEARNDVLMEDVSDLRNGLDSIEERARNELGLIRQGETFYLIVGDEPKPMRDTAVPATEPLRAEIPQASFSSEPAPEGEEEENPYLEMFRDDVPAASTPASAAVPAADQ